MQKFAKVCNFIIKGCKTTEYKRVLHYTCIILSVWYSTFFILSKNERVIFLAFNYKEQYAVVVMCEDEKEQEKIYTRLLKEGYKLKVVAV